MSLADIKLAYLDEVNLGYAGSFGEYLTTYYTKTYDNEGNFLGYERG